MPLVASFCCCGGRHLLVLVNRGCVGSEEDVFSGRRPELEDVSLFELVVAGGFYADAVDEGSVGRFEIHEVGLAVQASGGAVGEGPVLQDGVLAAARSVAERHVANVFVASQQIGRLARNMQCFNRIILVVVAAAAILALLFLKDVETPLGVGCSLLNSSNTFQRCSSNAHPQRQTQDPPIMKRLKLQYDILE